MTKDLQVENGNYTRILNPLIERLISIGLSGTELAICLYVMRKTYGYNKTQDEISLTQYERALNKTRPSIIHALKNLQLVNILILVSKGDSITSSNIYRLNKYHTTWRLGKKPKLVKFIEKTSKENRDKLVKKPLHTKDNIQKTIKKGLPSSLITSLLDKYPNNDGRKKSHDKLVKTITTQEQLDQLEKAMLNYLATDNVKKGFIKNMSTFVNNWQDWINVKPKEVANESRYKEFKA